MYTIYETLTVLLFWSIIYVVNRVLSRNRGSFVAKKTLDDNFLNRDLVYSCVNITLFLAVFLSLIHTLNSGEPQLDYSKLQIIGLGFISIVGIHLLTIKERK